MHSLTRADEALLKAKTELEIKDSLDPVLISITEGKGRSNPLVENHSFKMNDIFNLNLNVRVCYGDEIVQIKDKMTECVKYCDSIILIMDTYYREASAKEKNHITDLEHDGKASSALMCIVYTKEKAYMKILLYCKLHKQYTFTIKDWQQVTNMNPGNPFKERITCTL